MPWVVDTNEGRTEQNRGVGSCKGEPMTMSERSKAYWSIIDINTLIAWAEDLWSIDPPAPLHLPPGGSCLFIVT